MRQARAGLEQTTPAPGFARFRLAGGLLHFHSSGNSVRSELSSRKAMLLRGWWDGRKHVVGTSHGHEGNNHTKTDVTSWRFFDRSRGESGDCPGHRNVRRPDRKNRTASKGYPRVSSSQHIRAPPRSPQRGTAAQPQAIFSSVRYGVDGVHYPCLPVSQSNTA